MTDDAKPQEFPKMLYRGGVAYTETSRNVAHQDTVVAHDADEEAAARAEGFDTFTPPDVPVLKTDAMSRTALPAEANAPSQSHADYVRSTNESHIVGGLQDRSIKNGGDHTAEAAAETGTVDVSRSEDPDAAEANTTGQALETYHEQIAVAPAGPHIETGEPTPPSVASIIIDGKPDLPGVDGVREGKVQTDDLDRLDPSKNGEPDGIVLPPGGDSAHQNAVEQAGSEPATKTVDPKAAKT